MPKERNKKKKVWKEPKDKTQWLIDLIDAGESVVIGYEGYLLNKVDYSELANTMLKLRALLPMSVEDKTDKDKHHGG